MKLVFQPKTKTYSDILLTARARCIWEEQQGNIVKALEQTSGLRFLQTAIHARSGGCEEVHSGWPGQTAMSLPLWIRYAEAGEGKLRTLRDVEYLGVVSHELGHHLLLEHSIVAPKGPQHDFEAHQHLYLFLLDAWGQAYGVQRQQELIECELKFGADFHVRPLRWARRLSKAKRQALTAYLTRYKKLPAGPNTISQQSC